MPSGFMSCENNVSLMVYLLPLGKSIPDHKPNVEKSRAEDGKRECKRKDGENNNETMFEAPGSSQT